VKDLINHDDTTTRRGMGVGFGENTSPDIERIVTLIMDAAFKVHRALGPGLLESVYEECMIHELTKMGLKVARQQDVPVFYDGVLLKTSLRIDLFVEDVVVVELKAVEKSIPLHQAQLITYLKLTNKRIGLLINFDVERLKDGLKRIVL
jgi:GxxExxY protein